MCSDLPWPKAVEEIPPVRRDDAETNGFWPELIILDIQIYHKMVVLSMMWHNSCAMKLLIGLGNPGKKYERTRHNVGFLVVEEMAKQHKIAFKNKTSLEADVASTDAFTLLKPQTFMNVSGRSVKTVCTKHKCKASDILVIYDDADIPFGDVRYKTGGSSGGHNGMQSILDQFPKGTTIARIRIGIGRPVNPDVPLDAFVLQKWTTEEEKMLPKILKLTIEKIHEKIAEVSSNTLL